MPTQGFWGPPRARPGHYRDVFGRVVANVRTLLQKKLLLKNSPFEVGLFRKKALYKYDSVAKE